MLTLTVKDLLLLWRNKAALVWVIVFPLAFGLTYGAVIAGNAGRRAKLGIALVDEDQSPASKALAARLAQHQSVRFVTSLADGQPFDGESAAQQVRRGDLTAYLVLRPSFGESLRSFGQGGKKIELGIDPSRQAEAGFLQGIVMEATFAVLADQFTNPEEIRKWLKVGRQEIEHARELTETQKQILLEFFALVDDLVPQLVGDISPGEEGPFGGLKLDVVPVTYDLQPRSAFEITFPCSILWAVLSCMLTFTMSIVTEQKQGTLLRLRVAPLGKMHILGGKGLACFLSCFGTACILLLLGVTCLGVRVSSWPYMLISITAMAVCFSGLMMLLSVLGRTEQAVVGSAMAIMLVMATLGGGLVPLIAMPDWMLAMSHICPAKWGVLALEGAIWRGFNLAEMLLPWGILLSVGVLSFGVGAWILSRRAF
ncbi:MAG: ABC transporter permease [Planctomycetaceae bacterium]|nr:ABC transporter permease [Planctomycetaceae bacterium]